MSGTYLALVHLSLYDRVEEPTIVRVGLSTQEASRALAQICQDWGDAATLGNRLVP